LLDEERNVGEDKLRGQAIDKAVRLVRCDAQHLAPTIQPLQVEWPWTLDLPEPYQDWSLAGTIDLIEVEGRVRDLKTAAKSPSRQAVQSSDQLTAYALAYQKMVQPDSSVIDVALDHLIDLKQGPRAATQHDVRTVDDFRVLLARVAAAIDSIRKGVFLPARRTDWWCSRRWCGYADTCRYFRQDVRYPETEGATV